VGAVSVLVPVFGCSVLRAPVGVLCWALPVSVVDGRRDVMPWVKKVFVCMCGLQGTARGCAVGVKVVNGTRCVSSHRCVKTCLQHALLACSLAVWQGSVLAVPHSSQCPVSWQGAINLSGPVAVGFSGCLV
jgi:hypothetical protein